MGLIDKLKEYAGFDDPGEALMRNWRESMKNRKSPSLPPRVVAPDNYTPHIGYDKDEATTKEKIMKKKKRRFSTA